jgi:predicted transcriptional regulator
MEALWSRGPASVREIQEALPAGSRPAYTTVQTMVSRLEAKQALKRVKQVGNAHVYDAANARAVAERRLVDELLNLFGGRTQPVMSHLIESGRLTLDDLREAERTLRDLSRRKKP